MRCLIKRLEALEVVHAESTRPAPIGVALIPLLQGESYAVDLPEGGRKEFDTQEELFNFMDKRGPWDGLLLSPGMRSEADWLAAVQQA